MKNTAKKTQENASWAQISIVSWLICVVYSSPYKSKKKKIGRNKLL